MSKIVVAFGGNAIIKEGEKGTIEEQKKNIVESMEPIVGFIKQGHSVVITHGNGPQVGNALIRSKMAASKVSPHPLDVCGAETQGSLGYLIQQTLRNKLDEHNIDKRVVSIITQTVVSKDDDAFQNPIKPIGPFYTKDEMEKFKETSVTFVEDSGRGYRKVVPSPKPVEIIEKDAIKVLLDQDFIVIAAGGGGVPVVKKKGQIEGVEAVIDKDFTSALLAAELGADYLFILTGVEQVALDFGKPTQKNLSELTVEDAVRYLEEGQFPEGSMGPKIEAALLFLNKGGKNVIITSIDKLQDALDGKTGTRIVKKHAQYQLVK